MWVFPDTTEADTLHPVSVAILYRSDNRPFSTLHMIKIWTYKNQNRTGTAVFMKKKQPKPTADPKMETVTALFTYMSKLKISPLISE